MGRKKHLTGIEKAKMINLKVLDMPDTQIAKIVNRSNNSVGRVINSCLEEIDNNRQIFLIKLNEAGITYDYFIQKCNELLNSNRRLYTPEGNPDDVPDNNARAKVLHMIKDIIGLDAPKLQDRLPQINFKDNEIKEYEILIMRIKKTK